MYVVGILSGMGASLLLFVIIAFVMFLFDCIKNAIRGGNEK